MPVVCADGLEFHVDDDGQGEPLVLLHGFTGRSASWESVRDGLRRRFRTIAVDLIGHGASSAPLDASRYAFDLALDDLAQVTQSLEIRSATWLGYSLGGRLALGLALRHPSLVSALILESASPGIADECERLRRRESDAMLARRIEADGIEAFVAEWERLPLWQSQRALFPETLERQRQIRLGNRPVGLANSLRGMGKGAQPSLWQRLGNLQMPVLLIAGATDEKYVEIAGRMAAVIADAVLCIAPDAGHAVHLEDPAFFTQQVSAFLTAERTITSRK